MKATITIPLNNQDPVEVEATIIAGVMAVHQQVWDDDPKWVVSHVHTGMTFGIYALDTEEDALEAANMAAQSEAVLDTLAGKTRDECLDRTGEEFHKAIQAVNQVFIGREVEQAKAEHARLVESGEILSPSALAESLRENGWTEPEHFDEVLELVEQASDEAKRAIVDALIENDAGRGELMAREGYAEPGYDDPEYVVLSDNWNRYSGRNELEKLLETCGCAIEWSDEWFECNDCYKIVRISPDCHSWTPSYVFVHGDPVCHECMSEDEGMQRDYVESELEGDCNKADTLGLDLEGLGYTRLDENFQNGLYGGQSADPHKIGEALNKREITRFVFQIDDVGPFDSRFSCWVHDDDMPEGVGADGLDLSRSETDGVDPAEMMKAGLKDASEKMSKLSGEGVKVATCNADGTADVRLVSEEDFIAGNSIDRQ